MNITYAHCPRNNEKLLASLSDFIHYKDSAAGMVIMGYQLGNNGKEKSLYKFSTDSIWKKHVFYLVGWIWHVNAQNMGSKRG